MNTQTQTPLKTFKLVRYRCENCNRLEIIDFKESKTLKKMWCPNCRFKFEMVKEE